MNKERSPSPVAGPSGLQIPGLRRLTNQRTPSHTRKETQDQACTDTSRDKEDETDANVCTQERAGTSPVDLVEIPANPLPARCVTHDRALVNPTVKVVNN